MKKLRILCLHGYHGNAQVMRSQVLPLTSGLDHLAHFIYVDAPALAEGNFGWWHAIEQSTQNKVAGVGSSTIRYSGWAKTYKSIIATFEDAGPFDGVFGFSQGAALTALLVGLRAPDGNVSKKYPLAFDFAMMAGAFLANDPVLKALYEAEASYELPSAHIIGRSDLIVPTRHSYDVAALFKRPLVIEHGGGHIVDGSEKTREQIAFFLEQQLDLGRKGFK